jgi:hypothetical protein
VNLFSKSWANWLQTPGQISLIILGNLTSHKCPK